MTISMPNYFKMAQLWAKDRVKGDHAETVKEKHAKYAALITIGCIGLGSNIKNWDLHIFDGKSNI